MHRTCIPSISTGGGEDSLNLDNLYDDFLAYQEARGCSKLTVVAYRHDYHRLKEFLTANNHELSLDSLTGPIIRRYLIWLRECGYKPWTIRSTSCLPNQSSRSSSTEASKRNSPTDQTPLRMSAQGRPGRARLPVKGRRAISGKRQRSDLAMT